MLLRDPERLAKANRGHALERGKTQKVPFCESQLPGEHKVDPVPQLGPPAQERRIDHVVEPVAGRELPAPSRRDLAAPGVETSLGFCIRPVSSRLNAFGARAVEQRLSRVDSPARPSCSRGSA